MKDAEKCCLRCVHPVDKEGRIAMAVDGESNKTIRFDLSVKDAKTMAELILEFCDATQKGHTVC